MVGILNIDNQKFIITNLVYIYYVVYSFTSLLLKLKTNKFPKIVYR